MSFCVCECVCQTKPQHVNTAGNAFCSAVLFCTTPWLLSFSFDDLFFVVSLNFPFPSSPFTSSSFPCCLSMCPSSFKKCWLLFIYCPHAIRSISLPIKPEYLWQAVNMQSTTVNNILSNMQKGVRCIKKRMTSIKEERTVYLSSNHHCVS